jgi:hypothetical protein
VTALDTGVEEPPQKAAASRGVAWLLIGLFAALAVGEHIFFAFKNGAVLRDHGLVDTDSYMRVLRILDLYNGAGWYDTVTDRLGAPEGLSLHWTRPVDVLILVPALLAHAFGAPVDRAVYWIGASFSSVCHVLACFAAAWAAKPLWSSPGHRFAALILLTNAAAFGYGIFGRADHHTLLLLLTALMLGCMLRAALAGISLREQCRWAGWGGFCAGFGIWISPEMMVPIVPVVGTLGLFWLDAPADRKHLPAGSALRDWAGPGAAFSLTMAAVILVAIPIEQPPAHWFAAEYDKVSIPYLVLPLVWAAVFLLARRVQGGVALRSLIGALLAAAGFGLILLMFPDLLLGPLSVDPRLDTDFLDTVQEMRPLWPTSLGRLRNFLPMVGQSLTAIVLLPFAFRAWRGGGGGKRWSALLLTMAFGFMLIGALMHARLGVELAASVAVICAGFFHLAEKKMAGRSRLLRTPVLVVTATLLTCGPLLSVLLLPRQPEGIGCPTAKLADWLNTARPGKGAAPIVMTDDFSYAPELAFRTHYRFVAGPYHRGAQAIFDTVDTMRDQTGETARAILEKRQVSLVIRCIDVVVPRLHDPDHFNFYADLGRAKPPSWLTRITLPPDLSPHYRIYEVNGR